MPPAGFTTIGSQLPRPVERDGLVSKLHRNSVYLCRRAALASWLDTSGLTDKQPVLAFIVPQTRLPVLPDEQRSHRNIPGPN